MSINPDEYFVVENNVIINTKKKLPDMFTLPTTIIGITQFSTASTDPGFFDDFESLTAHGVVNIDSYAFKYCKRFQIMLCDGLRYVGEYAFQGTSMTQFTTLYNAGISFDIGAFDGCPLGVIQLPVDCKLVEGSIKNLSATSLVVMSPRIFTDTEKQSYFDPGARFQMVSGSSNAILTQMTEMNEKMTLLDKQLKRLTNMMIRVSERDRNSIQLLRAIRKGQPMR